MKAKAKYISLPAAGPGFPKLGVVGSTPSRGTKYYTVANNIIDWSGAKVIDWGKIPNNASVGQLVESTGREPVKCRFESD